MVPEGERAVVVLEAEEGVARALGDELPVQAEVHVVAGVDGVFVVSELEGEQRVLAPRHVGVHLDLGAFLVQVGVPLAAQGAEVDLEEDIGAGYQCVLGCVIQSDNPNRMEICSTKGNSIACGILPAAGQRGGWSRARRRWAPWPCR